MKAIVPCLAAVILLAACTQSSKTPSHSEYQSSDIEAMQRTYDFIKQNCHSTYFIATTDGEQPRVRPFGTINIFEGKLYIQTGHKKDVAKQIAANPLVELCAFDGQATWLRLSGTLVEDERIEAKKAMLDAYPELRSMYDENDEKIACYISLGYGANQGQSHKIKSVKDVSNASDATPKWFLDGVNASLLAPTAVNQQKFFFEYTTGNKVKAKRTVSLIGYTQMDLGIVKYHFEVGAGKENFEWSVI